MKIKLAYPKIPDTLNCPLKQCIVFEKIDGTNLHFVWTPQDSFHSFGTRRDRYPYNDAGFAQFNQAHPGLDGLKKAFEKMEQPLSDFFDQKLSMALRKLLSSPSSMGLVLSLALTIPKKKRN